MRASGLNLKVKILQPFLQTVEKRIYRLISPFQTCNGPTGPSRLSLCLSEMRQCDLEYSQELDLSKRVTFHKVSLVPVTKAAVYTVKESFLRLYQYIRRHFLIYMTQKNIFLTSSDLGDP